MNENEVNETDLINENEINGIELINKYLEMFGKKNGITFRPLDKSGYTFVKKGSATVGINVLSKQGVLIFLAFIMKIPESGQLDLYKKLLELNFLETADASFAIDKKSSKIYLRSLRGLTGLDYEEFVDILDTVAKVADLWDDRLLAEFNKKK
jgi:Tir chaperone protein (CesT) family